MTSARLSFVLTTIGRANVDAKAGDFNYAIEKLKMAVDKGEKNAETFVQLGNAYRKAKPGEGGGDAYQSYNKALDVDLLNYLKRRRTGNWF